MTNTDTADAAGTVEQVRPRRAGSELVRVTVNNDEAARLFPKSSSASAPLPIIGDFHYNGHLLLTKYPDCARALAKYRINPGNVGRQAPRREFPHHRSRSRSTTTSRSASA